MKTKIGSQEYLDHLRHSTAHLLAAAITELYPKSKRTIGPSIENGFYFDFDNLKVTDADFPKIEKKMHEIAKSWKDFKKIKVSKDEALKEYKDNEYKIELIKEFTDAGQSLTFYKSGDYQDLCRGGHVEHPYEELKYFKLLSVAGAYWRGSEKNKMLTRIYGTAFPDQKELDEYLKMLEEAEKRNHKKIGQELELYMFHETSPGMAYWLPKGVILYNELVNFWRVEHKKYGYQEIFSPLMNKRDLYETSGHWEHYQHDMFNMSIWEENEVKDIDKLLSSKIVEILDKTKDNQNSLVEIEIIYKEQKISVPVTVVKTGDNQSTINYSLPVNYSLKPMNCPNAMVIYGFKTRSYRDLPLRLSDTDALHRREASGTLNGLLRIREFRQDDAHIFVAEDQIKEEFKKLFEITEKFYSIFGLEYRFRLGTMPESHIGEVAMWNKAVDELKEILNESKKDYFVLEGDGAFYGPKIDILMKDSLGREWQMGTLQLDFQLPARFKLKYTSEDGTPKTPIVIHRVIYGSLERFIGIITEHFVGAFPVWISPVQVKVLPISEKHLNYAKYVVEKLNKENIRVELDDRNERLQAKIRDAQLEKVGYMFIVGDKEAESQTVSVRTRGQQDMGTMSTQDFIEKIKSLIESKSLDL